MTNSHPKDIPTRAPHLTLFRQVRTYAFFFAALLLIELLYSVLFLSAATDIATVRREVNEHYDYELAFRSMTQPQYTELYNQCGERPSADEPWQPYRAVRYERVGELYNAYVSLRGSSMRDAAQYFNRLYRVSDVEPTYSPLYDFRAEYLPDIIGFTVLCTLGVFALALFLLMRLYRLRMDRDTFAFGIYMTVGATFKSLYLHAAAELLIIGASVALPAIGLGYGVTALLYRALDAHIPFSLGCLLLTLLLSALTVLCAVFIPMKRLSRATPSYLLQAKDTTPYVISPRRSFSLFGAHFPRTFELVSLWRFRRYYALLMIASVLLPVLFAATCSLSGILSRRRATADPDFTVSFTPDVVNAEALLKNTSELVSTISEIEGVAMCLPEQISSKATRTKAHMLLGQGAVNATSIATVSYTPTGRSDALTADYAYATNLYHYAALDETAVAALCTQYAEIDGDPYAVLKDDHTVVITESMNNTHPLRLSVGDTVLVVVEAIDTAASVLFVTDPLELLQYQLEDGVFVYEEYTVGAIIHDLRGDDELTVGLNFDEYTRLTQREPYRTSVDVYLEDGIDFGVWQTASEGVYDAAFSYYNCTAHDHHVFFERYLTSLRNLNGRLEALAWSLCIMAVLICFYSQNIFYDKRNSEWRLLRSLGATQREQTRLFATSALIPTLVSLFLTLPLCLLADLLLYRLFNQWLPAAGFTSRLSVAHSIAWPSIALALVISLVCGLTPPLLALWRYRKQDQTQGGFRDVSEKR